MDVMDSAIRIEKTLTCPNCGAGNTFDLQTDMELDSVVVKMLCNTCASELELSLSSFIDNRSALFEEKKGKEREEREVLELREISRLGKSFACPSCGSYFDIEIAMDMPLMALKVRGRCPICDHPFDLNLDSFLRNKPKGRVKKETKMRRVEKRRSFFKLKGEGPSYIR